MRIDRYVFTYTNIVAFVQVIVFYVCFYYDYRHCDFLDYVCARRTWLPACQVRVTEPYVHASILHSPYMHTYAGCFIFCF